MAHVNLKQKEFLYSGPHFWLGNECKQSWKYLRNFVFGTYSDHGSDVIKRRGRIFEIRINELSVYLKSRLQAFGVLPVYTAGYAGSHSSVFPVQATVESILKIIIYVHI